MTANSKQKDILGLIGWLVVCFAASAAGAVASINAQSFYGQLAQPAWAPPAWLFGPVWTVLYAMMAIAAWMIWRSGGFATHRIALSLFVVQLALNALWTWIFFNWQQGALAFAEILLLWVLILVTLLSFWRIQPLAGALLIPYLAWVGFASVLNFTLWQLNPAIL